jgi:arylsulfatase A-like enzyme
MNSTLSFALLLAAALGTLSVATVTAPTPPPRPNILMMLVDDMGYSDVAAFGSTNVSTPHIDALIRRGVKMTQWISAASICTPSRASLQTGRYPIRTGCMGNVERYRVILSPSNIGGLDPTKHTSIATALKTAGYATGMSGKVKLPRPPFHKPQRRSVLLPQTYTSPTSPLDTLCPTRTTHAASERLLDPNPLLA